MSRLSRNGLALVLAMAVISAAWGDSRTWDGTTGNWSDGSKWGGTVPQAGDTVELPIGTYVVTLDSATSNLTAYTQYGGILLFTNWDTCLRAAEVTIVSGKMDHAACDTNAAPGEPRLHHGVECDDSGQRPD